MIKNVRLAALIACVRMASGFLHTCAIAGLLVLGEFVLVELSLDARAENRSAAPRDPIVFAEGRVAQRQLAENSPPGTIVGQPLTVANARSHPVEFSLPFHRTDQFVISRMGQLSTGGGESFDYESFGDQLPIVEIEVWAVDDQGAWDQILVQIEITNVVNERPLPPTHLALVADLGNALRISWTAPDNRGRPSIQSYFVNYRQSPNGSWFTRYTPWLGFWFQVVNDHSGSVTTTIPQDEDGHFPNYSVFPGISYDVMVAAVNSDGMGAASSVLTIDNRVGPPEFLEDMPVERVLSEGSPSGHAVGVPLRVTQPLGRMPTFYLEGALNQFFEIDANGQILTVPGAVYDYEARQHYRGHVVAVSGHFSTRRELEVRLSDVPDPPQLAPDEFRVGDITYDSIAIEWQGIQARPSTDSITEYRVGVCHLERSRELTGGGGCTLWRFYENEEYRAGRSSTEYEKYSKVNFDSDPIRVTIDNLESDMTYSLGMYAVNRHGMGPPTQAIIARTKRKPTAFLEGRSALRSVFENSTAGTPVGLPVLAARSNSGRKPLYSLSHNLGRYFTVDVGSGQLFVKDDASLDFETNRSLRGFLYASDRDASEYDRWCAFWPHPSSDCDQGVFDPTAGDAITVEVYLEDIDEPPLAPSDVVVSVPETTDSSLTLRWSPPDNQGRPVIQSYEFQSFDHGSGLPMAIAPARSSSSEAAFDDLVEETQYWLRVRAVNDEGTGAWSEWATGITPAAPAEATLDGSLGDAWQLPDVERSVVENAGSGEPVGEPVPVPRRNRVHLDYYLSYPGPNIGVVNRPPFSVDDETGQIRTIAGFRYDHEAEPSYTLRLWVSGFTSDGETAILDTMLVAIHITDVAEPPLAPTALAVTKQQATSLRIAWVMPAGSGRPPVTGFEFRQRVSNTMSDTPTGATEVGSDWANFADLSPDSEYQFSLRAINEDGAGEWSEWVTGRTGTDQSSVLAFTEGFSIHRSLVEGVNGYEYPVGAPILTTNTSNHLTEFRLAGDIAQFFTIDRNTGQVYSRASGVVYDYETTPEYSGLVVASAGETEQSADLTISITNLHEGAIPPAKVWVASRVEDRVRLRWIDSDQSDRTPIERYEFKYRTSLCHRSQLQLIQPDEVEGDWANFSGLEDRDELSFIMRAVNSEGGYWTDPVTSAAIDIPKLARVEDIVFNIPENTDGLTVVGELHDLVIRDRCQSEDGQSLGSTSRGRSLVRPRYSLRGPMSYLFTVNYRTGQMTTVSGEYMDYEAKSYYRSRVHWSHLGIDSSIGVEVRLIDVDEPPSVPAVVAIVEARLDSLTVVWAEGDNDGRPAVTGHRFEFRSFGDSEFASVRPQSVDDGTATFGDLLPATRYEFRVRSINHEGISGWSAPISGRTKSNPITNPPGSDSSAEDTNGATAMDSVAVERRVAENTPAGATLGAPLGDQLTNAATFHVSAGIEFEVDRATGQLRVGESTTLDFEAQPLHTVIVGATDVVGHQTMFTVNVLVDDEDEPPPAPAAPWVEGAGSSSIAIAWEAPEMDGRPALIGYDLEFRSEAEPAYTRIDEDAIHGVRANVLELDAGTAYLFRVRAVNDEGVGPWSAEGHVSTLASQPGVVISSGGVQASDAGGEAASTEADDSVPQQNYAPVFPSQSETVTIERGAAAGTLVGSPVLATDRNPNDMLTHWLEGEDARWFAIDPLTAQISVGSHGLDADAASDNYRLVVAVTDGRSHTGDPDESKDATMLVEVSVGGAATTSASLLVANALSATGNGASSSPNPVIAEPESASIIPALTRLSATVTDRIGAQIHQRFQVDGTAAEMTISGRRIAFGTADKPALLDTDLSSPFSTQSSADSWGGDGADLLRGVRFETPVHLNGTLAPASNQWSVWGDSEVASFDELDSDTTGWTSGQMDLSHIGVEARRGAKWLMGLAFSQGTGEVSVESNDGDESGVWHGIGMHPYLRWAASTEREAWAIFGAQSGEVRRAAGSPLAVQASMVAAGVDWRFAGGNVANLRVSGRVNQVRTDVETVSLTGRSKSEEHVDDIMEVSLNGVHTIAMGASNLEVYGLAGVRRERLEQSFDSATQIASGVRQSGLPWGWELDLNVEYAESLQGTNQFGNQVEATLRRAAQTDKRGFAAELTRRWSDIRNPSVEKNWWHSVEFASPFDSGNDSDSDWRASVSFGMRMAGGQQVLVPYGDVWSGGDQEPQLRVGLQWHPVEALGVWDVDLFHERKDHSVDGTVNRVGLNASMRF